MKGPPQALTGPRTVPKRGHTGGDSFRESDQGKVGEIGVSGMRGNFSFKSGFFATVFFLFEDFFFPTTFFLEVFLEGRRLERRFVERRLERGLLLRRRLRLRVERLLGFALALGFAVGSSPNCGAKSPEESV